ncbi:hypothetical protein Ancab_031166 [Ancistrocladus abbreviatus]
MVRVGSKSRWRDWRIGGALIIDCEKEAGSCLRLAEAERSGGGDNAHATQAAYPARPPDTATCPCSRSLNSRVPTPPKADTYHIMSSPSFICPILNWSSGWIE